MTKDSFIPGCILFTVDFVALDGKRPPHYYIVHKYIVSRYTKANLHETLKA